jgi:hypothetical protein
MLSSQTTYDQCDISNFVPTPSRDISRNSNWSPLTPPPIWVDFRKIKRHTVISEGLAEYLVKIVLELWIS